MKEGTIHFILEIPEIWPVLAELQLTKFKDDTTEIEIVAFQDGHFNLKIYDNKILVNNHDTQRVLFDNSGLIIFLFTWNEIEVNVYINDKKLKSYKDSDILKLTLKNNKLENNQISFNDNSINEKCEKWINWRNERFINSTKKNRDNFDFKTIDEQINELTKSIKALEHLKLEIISDDKFDFLLPNLLSILRSLLCWNNNKSNNPLLIRIAGIKQVGLPLYAFSEENLEKFRNSLIPGAKINLEWNEPCLIRKQSNQELIDFQEWLSSVIIVTENNNKQEFSIKDFIYSAADTGASHFDTDKPQIVKQLEINSFFGTSIFKQFVVGISEITIIFGNYLINNE